MDLKEPFWTLGMDKEPQTDDEWKDWGYRHANFRQNVLGIDKPEDYAEKLAEHVRDPHMKKPDRSTVYRWERGKGRPKVPYRRAIRELAIQALMERPDRLGKVDGSDKRVNELESQVAFLIGAVTRLEDRTQYLEKRMQGLETLVANR